jgi:hypothetical protein
VFINYVLPPSHCSHWGLLIRFFQTSDWLRFSTVIQIEMWASGNVACCVAQNDHVVPKFLKVNRRSPIISDELGVMKGSSLRGSAGRTQAPN